MKNVKHCFTMVKKILKIDAFFFQKQVIVILKHEVNMIMTLTKVHHPSILIKLTFVKKHLLDMDKE